ncbi:MAG TPA: hypothetical protein VL334_05820 [Anaerolineae bacterium]|nr:hypothetical protein [Anaerolineae bacterium]
MKTYTFHVSVSDLPDTWRRVELTAEQTLRDLHVAIQEALDWDPDDDIAFFVGENPLEGGEPYTINADEDWDDEDDEELEDVDDEEIESMVESLPPLDLGDAPRPESMEDALALIESNPELRAQVRQMLVDEMGVPGFMADMMLGSLRSLMEMMPDGMLAGLTGAGPEAKDAVTATLESLGLAPGERMLYMFGDDEWLFDVRLEAINERAEDDAFYPVLLDGDGPAPQQYTDDDEDEDDDWLLDMLEDDEEDSEEEV